MARGDRLSPAQPGRLEAEGFDCAEVLRSARASTPDDGRFTAALAACAKGLELDPEDAELWFRKGMVHRQRGESSEAEKCWRLILTLKRPDQFCSVDQGIYGHLTRRNLAVLAAERGDHAEVQRLWEAVLAECPGDREASVRVRRGSGITPTHSNGASHG